MERTEAFSEGSHSVWMYMVPACLNSKKEQVRSEDRKRNIHQFL